MAVKRAIIPLWQTLGNSFTIAVTYKKSTLRFGKCYIQTELVKCESCSEINTQTNKNSINLPYSFRRTLIYITLSFLQILDNKESKLKILPTIGLEWHC